MTKKYKCIMQDGMKDCGVSCLLTIIETYGGRVSKEQLRDMTKTTRNGVNAYWLLDAAKKIGFNTKAVKGCLEDLKDNMLPCIAHVIIDNKYKHFVVIHQINHKKKKIIIADPSKGIINISFEEFNNISTNTFLLLIPNKKLPIIKYDNQILKVILELVYKYKRLLLTFLVLSIIYTIANIFLSFKFEFIINDVLAYSSKNNLYFISIMFLIIIFFKALVDYYRNNLLNFINHELDYSLLTDVFKHIIMLPYLYYKNRTTGEIITRVNDLNDVKQFISQLFVSVFMDSILVIFVIFALYNVSYKLTIISLGLVIMYLFVLKIFNGLLNKCIIQSKENAANVNSHFVESFSGIDTIKGMCLEEIMINKLDVKYNEYLNVSYKFNKIYNLERFFKTLIDDIGVILIIFVGCLLTISNNMTLSQLITFNSLLLFFLEPIKNIMNLDILIKNAKISLKRVLEIYQIPKENLGLDNKYIGEMIGGCININKLNYSYNGRNNILNNINLQVLPGEKIIIYGSSGSGKSTLAKLLSGYIEVNRGTIFINNRDILEYNNYELRNSICYVSQNELIFTDTLYNNIMLNRDISYDNFLKACNITKVNEIIKDDILGYNLPLEENGFNLSGGEKQRIFLARAILKEANIYIFDESLSQIDIIKEREILIEMFKYLRDKTVIVISHRFNNMDLFDQKILIQEGELGA